MEWKYAISWKRKKLLTCSLTVVLWGVLHMSIPYPTLLCLYIGVCLVRQNWGSRAPFTPLCSSMRKQRMHAPPQRVPLREKSPMLGALKPEVEWTCAVGLEEPQLQNRVVASFLVEDSKWTGFTLVFLRKKLFKVLYVPSEIGGMFQCWVMENRLVSQPGIILLKTVYQNTFLEKKV